MSKSTSYTCDTCKKVIVSEALLRHNEPIEGHVYSRSILTVSQRYLIAVATYDGARDEWHFCSRECLAAFVK